MTGTLHGTQGPVDYLAIYFSFSRSVPGIVVGGSSSARGRAARGHGAGAVSAEPRLQAVRSVAVRAVDGRGRLRPAVAAVGAEL